MKYCMLGRLRDIGVAGQAFPWFSSYLENRTHCVTIKGQTSSKESVGCGVLQGSILGPQIFFLHVAPTGKTFANTDLVTTSIPTHLLHHAVKAQRGYLSTGP